MTDKTLRDEIAIAALQGLLANPALDFIIGPEDFASEAYEYADAMLAQRDKK